ncbi:GNAT family N-acetyltransferase [Myroides sp. M-43]|uniref:GNAT family N-acetyltransferase n=1 Tax=Myroides oncorhynchi TaxID=2893756 RepID=UPI001E4DA6BB|nr:GNAT family N-acetyltransferase [Myroides oncorhynchi]MCC9043967.1 GNAT family N-acetyltransferase [Myroides oncorhynchi]
MNYSFQYRFLKNINLEELLQVFNKSFSDYVVPMKLTTEQLQDKIKAEGIDLTISVGAFCNKELVGFILHAKNNDYLYNAGTGVLPSFRGNNLTTKMYDYAIPLFKSFNMRKINLEVISSNETANKSYRKIGFKKWRSVNCIKGIINIKTSKFEEIEGLQISNLPYYEYLISFAEKDIIPTWQNSEFCVNNFETSLIIKKAIIGSTTVGYLIFNPKNNRILQIWVKENYRRKGIASYLVKELIGNERNFTITNIDGQNFGIHSFFKSVGGEPYLEQIEMEMYLY